jgi:hypothetical protein
MSDQPTVGHWARTVEVNHADCGTCGQPMVYNLAAKVVAHVPGALDPCEWPWPDEPMPAGVKAEILFWRRGAEVFDRWLSTSSAPALGVNERRSEAEVLRIAAAEADARRARAEHAAADIRPVGVSELMRERLGAQVARRAERLGQFDLGGAV